MAALAVSVFLVSWGTLHYGFYTHRLLLDTPIYEHYGDAIVHGQVPYRDFSVEYPPGALPVFVLPALVAGRGQFGAYTRTFEGLMGLCGIVVAGCAALILVGQRARRLRLTAALGLVGLGSLAIGPVVLSRFDLWPTALTVASLAALLAQRRRLGFALLGLAFAAKLYPAVLLPSMLAYVWRRQGRRQAALCTSSFLAVSLALFLPFLLLAPHGVWASISGQATRPLQIESLGASLLLAAHQVSGLALTMEPSHGSDNLVGSVPHALALVQAVLQPLVVAVLWLAFARGPAETNRLLRTCAAVVCAFVTFSKVLSPQYLVWLLPLVPLLRGRRAVLAGGLLVLAMVLTQLWFPYRYLDLSYSFDATASWLVFARDLVLLTLLALLAWPERSPP